MIGPPPVEWHVIISAITCRKSIKNDRVTHEKLHQLGKAIFGGFGSPYYLSMSVLSNVKLNSYLYKFILLRFLNTESSNILFSGYIGNIIVVLHVLRLSHTIVG